MFGRLEDAYGDNEPEYTILDCISINPDYIPQPFERRDWKRRVIKAWWRKQRPDGIKPTQLMCPYLEPRILYVGAVEEFLRSMREHDFWTHTTYITIGRTRARFIVWAATQLKMYAIDFRECLDYIIDDGQYTHTGDRLISHKE